MTIRGEVFNGCVMVLSATLGVWPYTAIMEKMGKMWILSCCQVSWPVTVSIWWAFYPCRWLQWNIVMCLEVFVLCVVCMHIWFQCVFVFFWMCGVVVCSGVCSSVPCWSVLQCGMLRLLHVSFFSVSQHLVMSSLVCAWSLIGRLGWVCILSYLFR